MKSSARRTLSPSSSRADLAIVCLSMFPLHSRAVRSDFMLPVNRSGTETRLPVKRLMFILGQWLEITGFHVGIEGYGPYPEPFEKKDMTPDGRKHPLNLMEFALD